MDTSDAMLAEKISYREVLCSTTERVDIPTGEDSMIGVLMGHIESDIRPACSAHDVLHLANAVNVVDSILPPYDGEISRSASIL